MEWEHYHMETLEQAAKTAFWRGTAYRVRETLIRASIGLLLVGVWEGGKTLQREGYDRLRSVSVELPTCGQVVQLVED